MDEGDFITSLGPAFLAHRLRRASELILEGTSEILRKRGFDGPARSLSMMLLLRERGPVGVTELAFRLRLSHPMIIKLARALTAAGLARDVADPADQRRRMIALTERGLAQAAIAEATIAGVERTFATMSAEAGSDLFAALQAFEARAAARPIAERIEGALGMRDSAQGEGVE